MKYVPLSFLWILCIACSDLNQKGSSGKSKGKLLFYSEHIQEGRKLGKEKNYLGAAAKYRDAFLEYPNHIQTEDRIDAAYFWMLAGEIDSAFFQLNPVLADTDYVKIRITDLTKNKSLSPLRKYPQWQNLIVGIEKNRKRKFPDLNAPLADRLEDIHYKDQFYRNMMDGMQSKYSRNSPQMKAFEKKWEQQDSINLKNMITILDEYGWLGEEEVGYIGNSAFFLVIQHADSATQRKYLPMMRQAVKDGKASGNQLALLEDRVALGQGKKQIYGSQIGYDPIGRQMMVLPLADPEQVDQRRASVGLQKLSGYAMMWNLEWNPKRYNAYLPYYERNMRLIEKMTDSLRVLYRKPQ